MTRDRDATPTLTGAAIKAMFDYRARRVDAPDLRGPILAGTVSERQRGRWRVGLPLLVQPRLARGLVLVLIATAILAIGLIGSGALHSDPLPTGTAPGFVRPFEYRIPEGVDFRPSIAPRRQIIAWAAGAALTAEPGADPSGGYLPKPGEGRGIMIGSGAETVSHGEVGRFMLGTKPADFLTSLRDTGDVPMSAISETTLDGRPALTVTLPGTGEYDDIHVPPGGLAGPWVLLTVPSRLIVADIDGETIYILIWARTPDDLTAWMPVADAFVASIHFL